VGCFLAKAMVTPRNCDHPDIIIECGRIVHAHIKWRDEVVLRNEYWMSFFVHPFANSEQAERSGGCGLVWVTTPEVSIDREQKVVDFLPNFN